jgi:hypothetical protein
MGWRDIGHKQHGVVHILALGLSTTWEAGDFQEQRRAGWGLNWPYFQSIGNRVAYQRLIDQAPKTICRNASRQVNQVFADGR